TSGGLWLGAGAGLLARPGETVPVGAVEGGGWLRTIHPRGDLGDPDPGRLDLALTVSLQRARLDTAVRDTIGGRLVSFVPTRVADTSHVFSALDATLLAAWHVTRLDVTGSAALRHAPR